MVHTFVVDGKFKEHVRNMLTLRYDPMEPSHIPKLKPRDWVPAIYETTALSLENKLFVSLARLKDIDHIGIGLSSGIDSVLLLCLIREIYPDKKITAIHYKGINDEVSEAEQYAKAYGAEFVTIQKDSILDIIDWQVSIFKDMIWDGFDYMLFQTARQQHCQVLVDGTGADELFAGYMFRYLNFMPQSNSIEDKANAYLQVHNRDWVEDQANMFGPELKFEWTMILEHIMPNFGNTLPNLQQVFMADYNGKLSRLFTKKQRAFSRVYDMPVFSPYLDPLIIEYGAHLDYHLKIYGEVGKMPLRQIAARHDLIVTPKKYGFSHDVVKDWNGPHHDEAHEDLTDPNCQMFSKGLISYDWVKRTANDDKSRFDVRYCNKFMQLMSLEDYLRHLEFT